jgi:hypothetical protein
MKTIWVYEQGDTLRIFDIEEEAEAWFKEHDPEGVAFKYDVSDNTRPGPRMNMAFRKHRSENSSGA